jgi:hypothetical protein
VTRWQQILVEVTSHAQRSATFLVQPAPLGRLLRQAGPESGLAADAGMPTVFWFSLIWKIRLCGLAGKG